MSPILYFGEGATGMGGFITALTGTDGITSANLWAQITPAAAFLGAMVIFAFGYRVIRRIIGKASKGKSGV